MPPKNKSSLFSLFLVIDFNSPGWLNDRYVVIRTLFRWQSHWNIKLHLIVPLWISQMKNGKGRVFFLNSFWPYFLYLFHWLDKQNEFHIYHVHHSTDLVLPDDWEHKLQPMGSLDGLVPSLSNPTNFHPPISIFSQ